MTTLIENQPHLCRYFVLAMPLITVCDNQCEECKKTQKEKPELFKL